MTTTGGLIGMVNDTGKPRFFGQGNRFRRNVYRLPAAAADVFAWQGQQWDWTAWTRRFGQDPAGELAGFG